MSSPIATAVAALETEKANLLARVAKVDQAIANLRDLFHLPAERLSTPTSRPLLPTPEETETAVRRALANGPLAPAALTSAVGVDWTVLRLRVRALEQSGVLVSTGSTTNRRYALAAPAAAKEAL